MISKVLLAQFRTESVILVPLQEQDLEGLLPRSNAPEYPQGSPKFHGEEAQADAGPGDRDGGEAEMVFSFSLGLWEEELQALTQLVPSIL